MILAFKQLLFNIVPSYVTVINEAEKFRRVFSVTKLGNERVRMWDAFD